MKNNECKKCGHKWIPRKENPEVCPKCKTYSWKEKNSVFDEVTPKLNKTSSDQENKTGLKN